jgi:hypothetical protein
VLEWVRLHPDAIGSRSKCGTYSVCPLYGKSDKPESWEAWKLAPGGPWFANLRKDLPSEDAARGICEQDVQKAVA